MTLPMRLLLHRAQDAARRLLRTGQDGQALVETALVMPLLLSLALGVVGVSRVVQAQMGVSAVAREAARSAALESSPRAAAGAGLVRGSDVAAGYGLTNGSLQLQVDPGSLARRSGAGDGALRGGPGRPAPDGLAARAPVEQPDRAG